MDLTDYNYRPLAEGIYLEGLAWDFSREVAWYSDVIGGGIHGIRADGTPYASFNRDRMWTGGVMLNACGAVLSSGEGGVMWNDPDTGASGWLLKGSEDAGFNAVNEMWPDGEGGIWFGAIDLESIVAARPTRPCGIWRMAQDGTVRRVSTETYFPNGIAMDAARRRFYASDTFRAAWAWDVTPDLALANPRRLADKTDCDGLALEADGTVLITGVYTPGLIQRFSPDGTPRDPLPTPPGATTQIRFGGADLRDIYLVVVPEDAGDALKNGRPLSGRSQLWRGRSPVPGVACAPSRFTLR